MTINIINDGKMEVRFDGRTVIAELTIRNDIDHDAVGDLFRKLASGPLARMVGVFQREQGCICNITILVNTDEDVELVRDRLLVGVKSGNPDHLKCRVASTEEMKDVWETILGRVRHEQQNKPSA